jgi:hypothetical protein
MTTAGRRLMTWAEHSSDALDVEVKRDKGGWILTATGDGYDIASDPQSTFEDAAEQLIRLCGEAGLDVPDVAEQ